MQEKKRKITIACIVGGGEKRYQNAYMHEISSSTSSFHLIRLNEHSYLHTRTLTLEQEQNRIAERRQNT